MYNFDYDCNALIINSVIADVSRNPQLYYATTLEVVFSYNLAFLG